LDEQQHQQTAGEIENVRNSVIVRSKTAI